MAEKIWLVVVIGVIALLAWKSPAAAALLRPLVQSAQGPQQPWSGDFNLNP